MTVVTDRLPDTQAPVAPAPSPAPAPESALRFFFAALSTAFTVMIVVVACVALVLAVATRLGTRGQYTVFGRPVLIVLSGSMAPTIHTGDLIVDHPVSADAAQHLKVGQIVTFRDTPGSQTVITHRIVGLVNHDGQVEYVTKGDMNNAPDAMPRQASQVIGVFDRAIPRGGYILDSLHRPWVAGLILVSLWFWFVAGWLFNVARKMDGVTADREPAASATGETEAGTP